MGLLVSYRLALDLQVKEVAKGVCLFMQDSVIVAGLPFIYLTATNLSRAIQFGEFSERTVERMIIYLLPASVLWWVVVYSAEGQMNKHFFASGLQVKSSKTDTICLGCYKQWTLL